MKSNWSFLFCSLILLLLTQNMIFATDGDRLNFESEPGMKKGTIFFAPETDLSFHATAIGSNSIYGSEIYSTWGTIEKTEGVYDWSYIDNLIARHKAVGKKVALRLATANFSINDAPDYLYSKYNIRRVVAGYWENFEMGDKGYVIYGTKTNNAISGKYSLQMASTTKKPIIETGLTHFLDIWNGITNPSFNPTQPVYKYSSPSFCTQFDFKANTATTFYAKAYSKSLGETTGVFYKEWTATAGETGSRTLEFKPANYKSDYKVEIGIVSGNITIDNVNICDMKTSYFVGTLCFPNYFDPIYKERYEIFVKALADKYKDEPTLNSICVSGYGRWEEITISDHIEPYMFEDQWTTYGFTNEKYIDHIKWCVDTYKKYFTTKKLFMGTVGWSTDTFRDQILIDWKIGNYAAKNGVSLKYNGWQAMCSDWGSEATSFFYLANRYKFDKNVWNIFEEGGQVNNSLSEVMGHPISLFNRAVLDGMDYYWIYSVDLSETYFNRYQHYANEMAGSGLFTKLYNYFGKYDYYSPHMSTNYIHKNIWLGLFQNDNVYGTKWTYTTVNGERAVQTNGSNHRISISLDDRQRYNEMYGARLTIDYLDQGTDNFKVLINLPTGTIELANVTKTNSGKWKTISLEDNGWGRKSQDSGKDVLNEIEIDDNNDGVETFRSIEIDYVPAKEWQEHIIFANPPVSGSKAQIVNNYTVNIAVPTNNNASSISLSVNNEINTQINIVATVSAQVNGNYVSLGTKEYYMPEKEDWFYIPLAKVPNATNYRIILTTTKGAASINLGADNKPAFRLYTFATEPGIAVQQNDPNANNYQIEALKSFSQLQVSGQSNNTLTLNKKMPDGSFALVSTIKVNGLGTAFVEPQTPGRYQLKTTSNQAIYNAVPQYLKRLSVPTIPTRNFKGTLVQEFKADSSFTVLTGLKNVSNDQLGFHAELSAENPVIATSKPFSLLKDKGHIFHFIIKNETNSSLSKVYWKTDKKEYCEENSLLIPIVPNDTQFREYSHPIGIESGWIDKITGLKFMPVYGHTEVGKIGIFGLELRKGETNPSIFDETLSVSQTDFSVNPLMEIVSFKLENGSDFTEKLNIEVKSEISGRVPTDYLISEKSDFNGASWIRYNPVVNFTLSPTAGMKTVYFKAKDALGETQVVNASILFKLPNEKLDASTRTHISAFPNPVKSSVKFECTNDDGERFNVSIMSLTGVVFEQRQEVGNFTLNLSNYPKGTLLIKIENEKGVTQKIIIKD
jgi:hypothetical protein